MLFLKALGTVLVLCGFYVLQGEAVCGYESCPEFKSNMVNIHLVPHSHDDMGWLKTVDQYYYGNRQGIQQAGVQEIFETVIAELAKDSRRRFIQVETGFFAKWWQHQSELTKQIVKKLVDEGRLEFTGGAWSMNDEAAVNYQSVIDQFTLGLKFLNDNFGVCGRPRVGWQIDTFGHSREQASIFAQMGFDGQFFARMDQTDKEKRMDEKGLEMIWDASETLKDLDFFTGMLYNHYSSPSGFCFDSKCGDEPIIDDDSYENNVKSRIDEFLNYATRLASFYRSNHIMVPMGDDFQYQNAYKNYKNMDKLIKYVNERQTSGSKFNIFYSTASCYVNAMHQSLQSFPNKTQDFLPHTHEARSYWTGFFTTRPTVKRFERDGNHILQVAKQLSVLADLSGEKQAKDLESLREIMGVMQHHDAITGTEKQAVSNDYDRLMYDGILAGAHTAGDALRVLTNQPNAEFESCLKLNISECAFTRDNADNFVVTLYNPLAHTSTQYVRIPVKNEKFEVTDAKGRVVASEIVPVPWQVLALEFRNNDTQYELLFKATVNRIASYTIKKVNSEESTEPETQDKSLKVVKNETATHDDGETVVQTSLIKLVIDNQSGRLKSVEMNGVTENIEQTFGMYKTARSCHYIFRQDDDLEIIEDAYEFTVHQGDSVKEVHQQVNEWISQVIRIYENVNRVEFEWMVGPIPVDDKGKEVVTIFQSGISNNGVFYTDSNGREVMRREKDKREGYDPKLSEEPVSANYYPVTSRIAIQDNSRRLVLFNDRSQGGTSLENGRLEMMLHRRHLFADGSGADEAINEEQFGKGLIARGKLYLAVSAVEDETTVLERMTEKELHLPFWKFFSKASGSVKEVAQVLPDFNSFPQGVHLLTLEPFSKDEILLRVENFLDQTETNAVSFNIRPIFDRLSGLEIRETTLDGNLPLSDMKRLKFHHDGAPIHSSPQYFTTPHTPLAADKSGEVSEFSVTLDPMQIRTFIIKKSLA